MCSDIICPSCRQSFHETTDTYDPAVSAQPHMARLKDVYVAAGWTTFSPYDYGYGCMECPGCGAPYAPEGTLDVRAHDDTDFPVDDNAIMARKQRVKGSRNA